MNLLTSSLSQPAAPVCDADVVLRDGMTVHLRPVTPQDAEALGIFFAGVSNESLYSRFMGAIHPSAQAVARLANPATDREFVMVAECNGRIIGLAQYACDDDAQRAEAAFLVADAMQGRGIGTRMLEELACHARAAGVRVFHAWVMGTNRRMLQVFVDSGFQIQHQTDAGVMHVTLSLEATPAVEAKTAQRASVAARASLRSFFEPRHVAVVGASRDGVGVGAEILKNLRESGFGGRIAAIHPSAREIQGLTAYPRFQDVPHDLDLAVIAVPAAQVPAVAADALAKGVHALLVITAGFSETGAAGRAQEAELLRAVRDAGARMIGPNCMGLLNADPAVRLNATFSPFFPPAGRVAFSTQSGALGLAILEYAQRVNLGISTFASIGNKADVSSNDLIQYWADDPKTGVILLYLESFGNPRKFAQLARTVGMTKPIVAVKAGRSGAGARAASSHTGALAASDKVVDALFHHAGVIRTATLEQMFDVATLLDRQPVPAGNRVAILTNAGGPGILAADACEAHGLQVATLSVQTVEELRAFLPAAAGLNNPVDMLATASAADYRRAMALLLADPHVDSLTTIFIPPLVTAAHDVAAALTEVARTAGKPILANFMSVEGAIPMLAPIPSYRFPESAIAALARVTAYGAWRTRPLGTALDLGGGAEAARAIVDRALSRGPGWLTPDEAQDVMAAAGIPVVAAVHVSDEHGAAAAARTLGFPVALKGVGPTLIHKSDAGAVHLNLGTEAEVRSAYRAMSSRLGLQLASVLVQRMAGRGVEMFIGGLQDPAFGPVIFCGSGGVLVELFGDAVCRLCPLTDRDAEEMLQEVRGARRLRGFRGQPPADEPSLRDALLRVSALLEACPEILEMDINPVNVLESGLCALDVRIRVGRQATAVPPRRVRY